MLTLDVIDEQLRALAAGDRELQRDPYPLFAELRERDPMHWVGDGSLVITAHPPARQIYYDKECFGKSRGQARTERGSARLALLSDEEIEMLGEVNDFERKYMSSMNGEEHRRVRGAGQRAFTGKRMGELRVVAQELTDDLLDELSQQEVCDLMELCYKVPLMVIGDMLGAPREDASLLKRLGDDVNAHKHFTPISPEAVRQAHHGVEEFRAYAHELAERNRRDDNRTALASALLDANEEDQLTEDELAAQMVLILFAGHETTTNLIGNGTLAFMRFRDQWELFCSDAALAWNAVEELLRYDSPVINMGRLALADAEVGGVSIPAGTSVRLVNAACNRDPNVFPDPDRLDIRREGIDHLSFGRGIHFCLGGPLARLEGQVVFTTLAHRFPDMELAVTADELEWNGDPQLRGLHRLPIALGRDRGRTAVGRS